jgi:hypothetical protein
MNFLHPNLLNFLWLALIPIALWLFRRKAKRIPVSTLLFFRSLAREHQESAWLRRLKRMIALLLSLLVIGFAAFALSRPFREGGGDTPKSLVILLDRSASMSAVDDKGRSRLDEAKALLRARLTGLPENVICSLVLFDAKAEVAQSRSTNRRELLRLIEQVQPAPVEDRVEEALAVGARLAALDAPSETWLASDRPPPSAESPNDKSQNTKFLSVALDAATNVGITGFQIRPAPLARNHFEAFIEVTAAAGNPHPVEATLEARLDERPVQLRELSLKPGEQARLVMPLEGGKGQQLELEVRTKGDCLGWDNVALAPLPETKPLVVAWFTQSPDPFVELALSSLLAEDRIQVLKGGPKDWPLKEQPDVYVFENWLPKDWPADRPALVLNPPNSAGPIHAKRLDQGVPYETIRAVQPDHPVLYRVTSARVALTQSTILGVGDTLETLWMAGSEPVLAAGEANGQRIVVTAFLPERSEQLALLSAFPLLIGNALYWCAENSETLASLKPHRAGDLVNALPGIVQWRSWDGTKLINASEEVKANMLELRRIGVWTAGDGAPQASLLLSSHETDVPRKHDAIAGGQESATHWSGGGNWSMTLLWLVLAILLAESWLFHRQAVY